MNDNCCAIAFGTVAFVLRIEPASGLDQRLQSTIAGETE
jgi:hypothetical protein